MRKTRLFKALLSILLAAFILQAGMMAYSMAYKRGGADQGTTGQGLIGKIKLLAASALRDSNPKESESVAETHEETPEEAAASTIPATSSSSVKVMMEGGAAVQQTEVAIPADVLDLIRRADPAGYERNADNYRKFLSELNVHGRYQEEIENMIRDGKRLPDILIAYSYINDKYGTIEEAKAMVGGKTADKTWLTLFEEYDRNNPAFAPQSFDPVYLEQLLNTEGITKDDIMIADRVSQKLDVAFREVMEKRTAKTSWKDINAEYGIINGQEALPYVPVEPDALKKLTQSSGLPEQQVTQAFVIAYRLDSDAETIAAKMRSGYSKTRIYAEYLESRFE